MKSPFASLMLGPVPFHFLRLRLRPRNGAWFPEGHETRLDINQ
jgi:hypothetical protein